MTQRIKTIQIRHETLAKCRYVQQAGQLSEDHYAIRIQRRRTTRRLLKFPTVLILTMEAAIDIRTAAYICENGVPQASGSFEGHATSNGFTTVDAVLDAAKAVPIHRLGIPDTRKAEARGSPTPVVSARPAGNTIWRTTEAQRLL